ncbi:MAG: sulfite exporter TauE/SafE family protein [Polyangiaceae bacterium]|nr:sulfite exporter TauE/SafE family protein [Polyangiaceae bacterium]
MTSTLELILTGAFGALAGTLSGFLGIGGGAVLAPLLVLAFHTEQHRAQGISLAALVPPVGLPAVLTYRRAGVPVRTRLVVLLVLGFLGGAAAGAYLAHRVPTRELGWLFAAFLGVSAIRAVMSARRGGAKDATRGLSRRPGGASLDDTDASIPVPAPIGIGIGLAAGIMSGLLGVGGGLVALPLLRRFAKLGRLEAQATTLAMMLPPIGLPAVFVYAQEQGGLPWLQLAAVGVGFAAGAAVGAYGAGRVPERTANRAYAVFLTIMAVVLVVRS